MYILKILATITLLSISFLGALNTVATAQDAVQNENVYTFHYKDRSMKKIKNADDFALLESAKYSLKKGFTHFSILNTRHYDAAKKRKSYTKFGRSSSKRPRLETELTIACFDQETGENSHNAQMTKDEITAKY